MKIPTTAVLVALALVSGGVPGGEFPGDHLGPRVALARETYTAPPINVDVTGDSPTQARQRAIDDGQVKALRALLQSMVPAAEQGRLPSLDAAKADALVVDFSLANERTTAKRYLATLTVRFNAAKVDQLLAQAGVNRVAAREAPVLVLPVYQATPSAPPLLWEDTNPWAATWGRTRDLKDGLVPVVLALGDIEDVGIIDGKRALDGDRAAAGRLASRNGAPDAVIAHAQGSPETGLTVTLRGAAPFADLKPFTIAAGPKAFEQAITRIRTTLDDAWKARSALPPQGTPTLAEAAPTAPSAFPDAVPPGFGAALPPPPTTVPPPPASALPPGWQTGTPPLDAAGSPLPPSPASGVSPPAVALAPSPTANAPVILARFGSLNEWVEIRRRLQAVPGGGALGLQALARDQAQFTLPWGGSMADLQAALQGQGLRLTKTGSVWSLDLQGASVPGMTPLSRP